VPKSLIFLWTASSKYHSSFTPATAIFGCYIWSPTSWEDAKHGPESYRVIPKTRLMIHQWIPKPKDWWGNPIEITGKKKHAHMEKTTKRRYIYKLQTITVYNHSYQGPHIPTSNL
jgi:hypothetical protein